MARFAASTQLGQRSAVDTLLSLDETLKPVRIHVHPSEAM